MTASFPLRLDADRIMIGRDGARPAGAALLSVPGGLLWVDPLDPATPVLELTEPDRAEETVIGLFGLGAWQSIREAAATTGTSQLEVSAGWALADASRLAVLHWLAKYSPDPLDGVLLEMEGVALAARLSPLLPDPVVAPDVRRRALEVAAAVQRGEAHGIDEVSDLSVEVLGLLATTGDDEAAAVLHSLRLITAPTRETEGSARLWDRRSVLTPMPAGLVLDDETEPVAGAWSECATDWDLVPRGAFDPEEDAIRWRVSRSADGRWHVSLDIGAGWDPRGQYMARLHSEDTLIPLALVPLTLGRERWMGTSPLLGPPADPSQCWVDITSADNPRRARRGVERTAAEARRWAIRGVTRLRFGLVDGVLLSSTSPMDDAVGSLERARMAYATIGNDPEATGPRGRHLELGLALVAALERSGEHHEVDDLTQELAAEAVALATDAVLHGPGTSHLQMVDLNHPAWRLSAAELGLLVPSH